MPEFIQVVTTTAQQAEAQQLARRLVELRLAACVQVAGPIESFYWWQGKIDTAQEWQCWIKTARDKFAAVEAAIRQMHSYETPEILALPVVAGSQPYLKWLESELAQPASAQSGSDQPDA